MRVRSDGEPVLGGVGALETYMPLLKVVFGRSLNEENATRSCLGGVNHMFRGGMCFPMNMLTAFF